MSIEKVDEPVIERQLVVEAIQEQRISSKTSWKNINVKVKEQDLPILNNRLKIYGFETLGELVKDFTSGKFPQVLDDQEIQGIKENLQSSGQLTSLNGLPDNAFYKNVDYQDMHRYYEKLRKYSYGYARELTSYFRRYADTFFTQPESLHTAVSNHKRAWILNAMRAFGVYYEYKTQGNKEAGDLIYNIIRRYQLNKGLDMHHKIYLVDENYVVEKLRLLKTIPGELGFITRLGLFSGLREEELVYVYQNRNTLQTVEKRNGQLTIVILNRFEGHKKAYFTILPTQVWKRFKDLPMFSYKVEITSAHKITKQVAGIPFKQLRKLHWNVMSKIMTETEADILAGRAKSISAKHYALYELDQMADKYYDAWRKYDFDF